MTTTIDERWARWLEWLAGRPALPAGQGVESTLEHSWPLAPWATLLLLILCGALVVLIYVREGGAASRPVRAALAGLRLSLIALVVLMMFGFVLRPYTTNLPDLVVLGDDSRSMALEDVQEHGRRREALAARVQAAGGDDLRRITLAKTLFLERDAALVHHLAERYQVKFLWLSDTRPAEPARPERLRAELAAHAAEAPTSPLGDRLRQLLEDQRGRATAAVVLLSDGITTEGRPISQAAEYARLKGIPLYLVGIGSDQPPRDVELADLLADDAVFVHDIVNLDFAIRASGFGGRRVELRLRRGDSPIVLARTQAILPSGNRPVRVRLSDRPAEKGHYEYVIDVDLLEGEARSDNNQLRHRVHVRDDALRVLLVQGYPSYEFRYLKSLLGRAQLDDTGRTQQPLVLTTILQEADLEYSEIDETAARVFPVRREELAQYDVVIIGDANPAFLSASAMTQLVESVRDQGKGIIFIAGPRFLPLEYRDTPLASLFPFDVSSVVVPDPEAVLREPFAPLPTRLGLATPHLQLGATAEENARRWRELPELYWMIDIPQLKPSVRVLVEHPTRTGREGGNLPLVCLQYVGAGKVLFHATDETWRWRYRMGDLLFARYWMQTIRYLSRAKLGEDRAAELVVERERFERGEPVRLRARFFDDRLAPPEDNGVTVVLEQEGRRSRRVTLQRGDAVRGTFEGTLTTLGEGKYHAWMAVPALEGGAPSADFLVTATDGETSRLEMDGAELRRAAELSGGRFYTLETAGSLLTDLPRGRQVRIEALPPRPIWNSWKIALVFVVLLVAEWLLRRRAGLI